MINNYAAIKFTRISLCTCCKLWLSKKSSFKSFLTRHAKLNFGKNLRREEAFCCSVTSLLTDYQVYNYCRLFTFHATSTAGCGGDVVMLFFYEPCKLLANLIHSLKSI